MPATAIPFCQAFNPLRSIHNLFRLVQLKGLEMGMPESAPHLVQNLFCGLRESPHWEQDHILMRGPWNRQPLPGLEVP